jgi:hypothetical protein
VGLRRRVGDAPVPGRSTASTRYAGSSRRRSPAKSSRVAPSPCTRSNRGPLPALVHDSRVGILGAELAPAAGVPSGPADRSGRPDVRLTGSTAEGRPPSDVVAARNDHSIAVRSRSTPSPVRAETSSASG